MYYIFIQGEGKTGPYNIYDIIKLAKENKVLPNTSISDEEDNYIFANEIISFEFMQPIKQEDKREFDRIRASLSNEELNAIKIETVPPEETEKKKEKRRLIGLISIEIIGFILFIWLIVAYWTSFDTDKHREIPKREHELCLNDINGTDFSTTLMLAHATNVERVLDLTDNSTLYMTDLIDIEKYFIEHNITYTKGTAFVGRDQAVTYSEGSASERDVVYYEQFYSPKGYLLIECWAYTKDTGFTDYRIQSAYWYNIDKKFKYMVTALGVSTYKESEAQCKNLNTKTEFFGK